MPYVGQLGIEPPPITITVGRERGVAQRVQDWLEGEMISGLKNYWLAIIGGYLLGRR